MGGTKNPVKELGRNIERNVGNVANSIIAMTRPGGLNNLGQTLAQNYLAILSTGLINPETSQSLIGENNLQRAARETAQGAENQRIADAAAAVAEENRQVASTIEGLVTARRRAPGRAATRAIGGTNSLLTFT